VNAHLHPQKFCETWKNNFNPGQRKIGNGPAKQKPTKTSSISPKLQNQRRNQFNALQRRDAEELIVFLYHAGYLPSVIWSKVKEVFPEISWKRDFVINTLRKKGNPEIHARINLITKEDFSTIPGDPSWRLLQKKMQFAPRPKNHPMTVGDYEE
jgi:hypothetical protein